MFNMIGQNVARFRKNGDILETKGDCNKSDDSDIESSIKKIINSNK